MNFIKKGLLAFFATLFLIFIVGLFLPGEYKIIRTHDYNCAPEYVFDYISNINNMDDWFYITKSLDSTLQYKYKNDSLRGLSSVEWNGEAMGQGVLKIDILIKHKLIKMDLAFQNNSVSKSSKFEIMFDNGITTVKWTDYGEHGWNPVHRIFGLFIDGFLGPDMEKSLQKIEKKLECKNV